MALVFSTLETLPGPAPRGSGSETAYPFEARIPQMTDIALLTTLIEPEARALGLALVRVAMFGGKSDPVLQVMAERADTRQLDLSDCEALSRRISDVLDAAEPIEEAYRLEVSSPGIDRPLTRLKDFDDWVGFEARVNLSEKQDGRKQFSGKLLGTKGDDVLIYMDSGVEAQVPFPRIKSAKLLLTDALIAATAPLSAEGADTIIEEESANDIAAPVPQEG